MASPFFTSLIRGDRAYNTGSHMRTILLGLLLSLSAAAQREPLQFDIAWVNPPKDAPRGVTHHVIRSAAMQADVGFNIYLPSEYASAPSK